MKRIYYGGLGGFLLFEILKVYLIMPFPGSQKFDSLGIAYFLHTNQWYIRIIFLLLIISGAAAAFHGRKKWIPAVSLLVGVSFVFLINFRMQADRIFRQPKNLIFKPRNENILADSSIVVAVENRGEVKAYPLRYIIYHHQVQDIVGGKPVMVTYCSVCRTGRVYDPVINGKPEKFRLVGMDHFNAMFEDHTTKSWWRQVNGEAVAGPLKGQVLSEIGAFQFSLGKLFVLYPDALVMQPDEYSISEYDSLGAFESGRSKSRLTRTDSISWEEKSWVVGLEVNGISKAYDWNLLLERHLIHDRIGETPVLLVVSEDGRSFTAFERNAVSDRFCIRNDTLYTDDRSYDFSGKDLDDSSGRLLRLNAYQEFWHSWRTFHPATGKYTGQEK